MLRRLRIAALAALAVLLLPAGLFAQAQARIQGTVIDEQGEPVPDVQVTILSEEIGYEKVETTNKKGRFSVLFVDGTRIYTFRFEKEGYRKVEEAVKPEIGGNLKKEFQVPTLSSGAQGGAMGDEITGTTNPAINVFNEGVTAFQAGDMATAKEKFQKAMERDASMVEPYSALAGIYQEEGDLDQAAAMARKVLELEPQNGRAMRVLYDIFKQRGDDAAAQEMLEQLKTAEGGTDTAVRIFNEGADAARLGDLDSARSRFEEALEVDPELAPAHSALARIYLLQGEYDRVIAAADAALDLDPGMTSVLKYKYEAYRQKGDTAAALEIFQTMAQEDPEGTARALYDRGVAMFNAGDMAGAKTALEQALSADPSLTEAHYTLGLCYINAGETAKAKEHLQTFIDEAPEHPDAATARDMLQYL